MGEIIDFLFDPFSLNNSSKEKGQQQAPSAKETIAQTQQKEIIESQKTIQRDEAQGRQRIITARAAGPQTLLTRRGSIPKAIKLGGSS